MANRKLFEVISGGDPYSRAAEVREYPGGVFSDVSCIYCGDLSGRWTKRETERQLRRMFPNCKIRRGD
jgi:hypothetical protein